MNDEKKNPPPANNPPSSNPTPPQGSGSANNGASSQNSATTNTKAPSQNEQEYSRLKAELEQTQTKLQEMMTISQHALADLQNFRRRADEEKTSFIQYANAELILDLLPVIDNISRALAHEPKDADWIKGIEQVFKQLSQVLGKRNLKTIETVGKKFDPNLHEALMVGPGEKDMVLEEFEKGYMLGERVIKHARVKVGDGTSTPSKQ